MEEEQEYCLRWNNFQANITSQFEALRVDQDFTDVSIVCDSGLQIQAHRVVLSACSPLFKELFKNNPCTHPIIFMRDVDEYSVRSLLMFMYAGEVNVAQAHLSDFLRTAESLQIRGLTEPSTNCLPTKPHAKEAETTTNVEGTRLNESNTQIYDTENNNEENNVEKDHIESDPMKEIKIELPEFSEYFSDVEEVEETEGLRNMTDDLSLAVLGMSQPEHSMNNCTNYKTRSGQSYGVDRFSDRGRKLSKELVNRRTCEECGQSYSNISNLRQHMKLVHFRTPTNLSLSNVKTTTVTTRSGKMSPKPLRMRSSWDEDDRMYPPPPIHATNPNHMIKLADGIEVHAEQLRGMKWSDYRKLTRGLASILFRPEELASCSVTGQRWSRAGNDLRRPVKPALDRAKVQAIISYVATRFPMIEISRIKQVLAYKCKENSTAFKMKAVRYFA